jgi:hypothetical protein
LTSGSKKSYDDSAANVRQEGPSYLEAEMLAAKFLFNICEALGLISKHNELHFNLGLLQGVLEHTSVKLRQVRKKRLNFQEVNGNALLSRNVECVPVWRMALLFLSQP